MPAPGQHTKRCQQLFDEALERVPVNSPEWTDFNGSDPGITLVQLFAWLSETLLYRAKRIPERQWAMLRRISGPVRKRWRRPRVVSVGRDTRARSAPARFVAAKLGLRLYRIDLSSIRSKYIGETEKNLRQIFNAAEEAGAILFLDEADPLLGKRTEIKDGHDRFANVEVDFLLRRLESFKGVAILAIKHRECVKAAALRRKKWVVYEDGVR